MRDIQDNPDHLMQQAQLRAQNGDLAGAAELCRAVVARTMTNFQAFFMLGTIESHFGRFEEAEKHLRRAVEINPRSPEALTTYGNALLERKKPELAVQALGEALKLQPQNPVALLYRGLALAESGKHNEAVADFDQVLRIDPNSLFALHNRATALIALNRLKDARSDVAKLLGLAPNHVPGLANYALLLNEDKKYPEALGVLDRALSLEPNNPDLTKARALALMGLNRSEEALACFRKALARQPGRSDILLNCGNMLMELDRLDEALQAYEQSIAAQADYAPALLMRANLLQHLGRTEEAFAAYDTAVDAKPDYAEGFYHRGSALLLHGRFEQGWRDFERRWETADCTFTRPKLRAAEWRCQDLAGRSIVVYSEQGLGDTIQFARFLPRLVELGAKVTFLCHSSLVRLFQPFAGTMEVTGMCDAERAFDFQCALMSLPERLGTTLKDLPGAVPYLFAEAERAKDWAGRIGTGGFKTGIAWQGNPNGLIDKGRSVPLTKFRPLVMPGVRLISLQRTHGLDQLALIVSDMPIETLGAFDAGKDAFIDTAEIMQNLDLVITSDTAIAHLAGALGRPCWVALKHLPDWRWMTARSDSPWYPSLRLFRQSARGDWDSVFAAMAALLHPLAEGSRAS